MPAWRLGNQPASFHRFDVAGQDAATEAEFVRHVGLLSAAYNGITCDAAVSLDHMGPPLRTSDNAKPIQTIGAVPLTADQQEQVRVFVNERDLEYKAEQSLSRWRQYVVHPHVVRPNESFSRFRFSCSGFVMEAYREAGIGLIEGQSANVPRIDAQKVIHAYPELEDAIRNVGVRKRFGLQGDGPWPVVLAGYVLSALNRTRDEILAGPHTPLPGDEYFPPHRLPASVQ